MSQARLKTEPVAGVVDPVWSRLRQEAEAIVRD